MDYSVIDKIIIDALKEDMPQGDITTENIIDKSHQSFASFIAKEDGIISGIDVCKRVFEIVGGNFSFDIFINDSKPCKKGDIIATIKGDTHTILKGERVSLNLLQRMCGIASSTNKYVNQLTGKTKILDTRKTTPNLRYLEKKAVTDGGGTNHRYCLSDQVMIKDNHINAVGSITKAVDLVYGKVNCKIEVEVENYEQFLEAQNTPCDIIMLDNMSNELMLKCVKTNKANKLLEASGNMTIERIKEVSMLNVDFISVGAITHSVKALDISLKFK